MPRTGLLLLLLLGAAACAEGDPAPPVVVVDTLPDGRVLVRNDSAGLWDDSDAWRAVEVARIGAADAADLEYVLGDVADVELDPLGRVWVLDRQANELRLFDREGRHVRTVGREGAGPGEFRHPIALTWSPRGELWVVDIRNQRYEVFDTAGRHLRSHRRNALGWGLPWGGGFDRAGNLYEPSYFTDRATGESRQVYVRHRVGEEVAASDTFPLPTYQGEVFEVKYSRGNTVRAVPFSPRLHWRFDGSGGLWTGTGDPYRLVHRSLAGDTLRVVERAHTPVPVSAQERAEAVARLEEGFRPDPRQGSRVSGDLDFDRIPEVKPAFESFVVDDRGYLWVTPSMAEGASGRTWHVFDPEGRFLGSVAAEVEMFPLPRIRGDRMAGVVRDEMDVQYVVVYRLEGRAKPDGVPAP